MQVAFAHVANVHREQEGVQQYDYAEYQESYKWWKEYFHLYLDVRYKKIPN